MSDLNCSLHLFKYLFMNKLYILSCFLIFIGGELSAQETATPVLNKSNRIILHFNDTTGLFNALARILIDRGHEIDMINREFGILRTKASPIPGGYSYEYQMEVKTIFRDSTITFSSEAQLRGFEHEYEVMFTKKRQNITDLSWDELMLIAGLLKPASVTYMAIHNYKPYTRW